MSVTLVEGDVFDAPADALIIHQGNCLTRRALGIAATIATRFPYADVYAERMAMAESPNVATPESRGIPGTVVIRGWRERETDAPAREFGMLMAQYAPGSPGKHFKAIVDASPYTDSRESRLVYFAAALEAIPASYRRIAVPWKIGCGLAGGDWAVYERLLRTWAAATGRDVTVYKQRECA